MIEETDSWVGDKGLILVIVSIMSIVRFVPVHVVPKNHEGDVNGTRWMPAYVQWVALQERNHERREPASFIVGSKPA